VQQRDGLLVSHRALAGRHAKRFLWSGATYDELFNVAWIGLAKAAAAYDPERFNNGFTAYAIHWIRGELLKFVTKRKTLVPGRHTEDGEHLPRASRIQHFGNVAKGNGEIQTDTSLSNPLDGPDNDDDEDCSGEILGAVVERSLEDIRGDFFWERRLRHVHGRDRYIIQAGLDGATLEEIGRTLGISAERVRQLQLAIQRPPVGLTEVDEYEWRDHQAKQFRFECLRYCADGIAYLYRNRRQSAKCQRPLLPYEPPESLVKITGLAPAAYSREHQEILRIHERVALCTARGKSRGTAQLEPANATAKLEAQGTAQATAVGIVSAGE
jgi:RNA polymerase sigma factor (sigma-70 family)